MINSKKLLKTSRQEFIDRFRKNKIPKELTGCPIKYLLIFLDILEKFINEDIEEVEGCELTFFIDK